MSGVEARRRQRGASRRAVALPALAATLGLAACGGTPSPDLFVVERSGSVPGARLTLLVSDTSVRCNRAEAQPLPSDQILDARDLLDDLLELQASDAPPPRPQPAQSFDFVVQTEEGRLSFTDRTLRPEVLARVAIFTRTVAQDICGLDR